ncbi:GerAB/ArcD/ProY family transporter [Guptibacillus hwajinpoensis]|uniref:GerAB/ArcD/ProY family transporter n=1 Tax=Guptibacillus hwajinpoensis TaxID=208199 RepID=UPI00273DD8D0|nr:GerAB/ArcD/ProY family transporter [Pseudalkalibacillus hwajinpoensis]WLR59242.1 GerAB/ArcD/ProY family transporter [Pseudalkalibacillus hwajinpoensis]
MKNNHTSLPIIIFIISTIVGVGIVTLPRQTATVVSQSNMWMSVILGAGMAFINAIFLFMLIKRFPMKTVFDISTELTGRWIGKGINLIFVAYMIAISSYIIRTMAEIVNYYLLDNTPKFIVLLVLVVSCMYLVSSGLSNIILFFSTVLSNHLIHVFCFNTT